MMKFFKYGITVAFLLFLLAKAAAEHKRFVTIQKPDSPEIVNFSGDEQYGTINEELEGLVRVQVMMNNTTPIKDFPVYFEVVSTPHKSDGFKVQNAIVKTDHNGIASTAILMGSKPGDYEVSAQIKGLNSSFLIYRFHARNSNWVLMLVIGLIGGLGLFLFGMNLMSEGMSKAAGDRMRSILSKLTHNRFIATAVGAFVTMVIQSSSVTTVMLVGFVHSRLMSFRQTIGVMLGAAIGTTITAQLIAFKLTDYSLLVIGIGAALLLFVNNQKAKSLGESILGFGILFFGMYIMSEAMYPLRSYQPFIDVLLQFENPILGILTGALFTAIIQSSSASIGIMIILASQGLLSLEASIPLVMGANLGTAITAVLASIKTNRESKKVALAHTLIKFVGLLIFVGWIPYFSNLVEYISPHSQITTSKMNAMAEEVPRQIANAHTVFNVILVSVMLPFTSVIGSIVDKLMPIKEDKEKSVGSIFLDKNLLNTPSLALNVAKEEALRMALIVKEMNQKIILAFLDKDVTILKDIRKMEMEVDSMREAIKDYLIKISRESIEEERVNEAFQIMYTIKEFEQIGDVISTNMASQAEKWIEKNVEFSEEGQKEITEYHIKAMKQISRAIEVFRDVNLEKALVMKEKYKKYADIARGLERSHYERLQADVSSSLSSSNYHIEIINMLKMITSHSTNIARILVEWTGKEKKETKLVGEDNTGWFIT